MKTDLCKRYEDEDLAIAIGRNGQNIKLVSKITGIQLMLWVNQYDGNDKADNEGNSLIFIFQDKGYSNWK